MNDSYAPEYGGYGMSAAEASIDARRTFIQKTYLHLAGAVFGFVAITGSILSSENLSLQLLQVIGGNWWMALLAFMVVSWVAQKWAHSSTSVALQYAGLGLYTFVEAIIFVPLLMMATASSPDIIPAAGMITLAIFGGLTATVFLTKADFSFMRGALWMLSIGAMITVFASMIFGFQLGIVFVGMMIVLLSGWILYDTSNVLHHYRTDQHVGASLALFASLATLFWYIIRLLMILQSDD